MMTTDAQLATGKNTLLEVQDLKKHFPITKGLFSRVTATSRRWTASASPSNAARCSAWLGRAAAAKRRSGG